MPLEPRARAAYGAGWKTAAFFLQAVARLHAEVNRDRANDQATAAYRATHNQPWEKKNLIVLGDLRPARVPEGREAGGATSIGGAISGAAPRTPEVQ